MPEQSTHDQFTSMLAEIAAAGGNSGRMDPSAAIRRRGQQRRNRRRAAAGALAGFAVATAIGTGSYLGMYRTSADLPAAPPGLQSSAAATPSVQMGPTATPSASAGLPSSATASGSAEIPPATGNRLTVSLTGLSANVLRIGGPPVQFTVTVTNPTAYTFRNIAPNVSLGHCTCSDGPVPMAPQGTLQWRQPDGSWRSLEYARAGGDIGMINAVQVPGFALAPGATSSFTYRIAFTATQQGTYHNGESAISVMMVGLAGYAATGPVSEVASPGEPGAYAMAILGGHDPDSVTSVSMQVTTG